MSKVYMARHGLTAWNLQNKICGTTDLELTEEGIRQARILGEKVAGLKVDLIVTSAMKRARQTGGIIGEMNGIPVISDARLAEVNFGKYEGVDRQDAGYQRDKLDFACRYPNGGESTFLAAHRLFSCLDDLKEKYPGKNLLIVGHGSACRIMRTYFEDVKNEEFYNFRLDNCEIAEYKW
ncbi:MAG: histidine phosphatase family protein [Blautia sp.]|jgi:broad specificity phosphatase PhoE